MFCPSCGHECVVGSRFCAGCGAGFDLQCSRCSGSLSAGAGFCPACGQAVKMAALEGTAALHTQAQSGGCKPETARGAGEGWSGALDTEGQPGEHRLVTVLFADFAGFTAWVHREDVEEVRDFMDSAWARIDSILLAHGGLIEKHIGDAVMAVFGAVQAREDDPVQAVRAALAIQETLRNASPRSSLTALHMEDQSGGCEPGTPNRLLTSSPTTAAEAQSGGWATLQMRVGVNTGSVVTGRLSHTGEFVVTGDTVNLASRLEQHAPPGGVLIAQETYRQVYGFFNSQAMAPLNVKGKPEPVQSYLVIGAKPRAIAAQLRGVEGVQTEMIGREEELKALKSAMLGVIRERSCRVITVLGEAGIGKTRLLREFQEWVELLSDNVRLFSGRATPEMVGLPFSLIRDLFCARFEIQENDPPAVAREKLERGVASLLDPLAGKQESDFSPAPAHYIGQLLGLDYAGSSSLRNILRDTDQVRHGAFHYLSEVLVAASSTGCSAALLVAEDIHWSDDGSLDLIQQLAQSCQGAPLLIVCLARPNLLERRPNWCERFPAHSRLDLRAFSAAESRTLVCKILDRAPVIPQVLSDQIVSSAEGIPLFIEEIIKMFMDQRVIVPGAEHWRIEAERLAVTHIPSSLTGILQARLDGLLPAERALLQRASVVGRVFWDASVEALSQPRHKPGRAMSATEEILSRERIRSALAGLRRKELILRSESSAFAGATEYTFKHELLRSVTYENLLRKARREYHARAAEWLIDASQERIGEFAGLVAAHYELAARQAEAVEWYGRAGHQARLSYAPAAAIDCYRKALAPLPSPPILNRDHDQKRLGWLSGLVEVLGAQARYAEGVEACAKLRQLAESLEDPIAQAHSWNDLAFLQERRGQNRASVESAVRAEALAREAGEGGRKERVRALHLKGWACYRLCDAPSVLALANESLKLCSRFGDRRGMATSYKLKGVAHLQLGHFQKADSYFKKGKQHYLKFSDRRNIAAMWSNLGESARLRGDFQAAVRLYEKALAMARQIGHRGSESIYLTNLSGARLGLGQFAQAEADLGSAIRLHTDPNSCSLSETYAFLSEALLGQGKLQEALTAVQRALALARESENELYLGGAWSILGRVAAAFENRARLAPAATVPANGVEVPKPVAAPADGCPPEPAVCFANSLEVFRRINARSEEARVLRCCAEYQKDQGRLPEAEAALKHALNLFEQLGAVTEIKRTRDLLRMNS